MVRIPWIEMGGLDVSNDRYIVGPGRMRNSRKLLSFDNCSILLQSKNKAQGIFTSVPLLFVDTVINALYAQFLAGLCTTPGTGQGHQSHIDAIANSCSLDTQLWRQSEQLKTLTFQAPDNGNRQQEG